MTYDPHANSLGSWELAVACLRAQHVAGGTLSPDQMVAAVDAAGGAKALHAGSFRRLSEVVTDIIGRAQRRERTE